ncbi:polysaccharide deacetylase family protein [Salipaludibacillus sp. LMS25]|jgi:peptidoglycan/xylan/chitin deacetylase (PgdA/CDA1 family)|uniref:polysaccharide deacetylase family protein n=1 Tax=Salipaludibacillus sp. LMS25 TaxID=2924031 RepID=UPI0020D0290D|nr:polysaccharide deacetylase family protein [Salipaludibacillus sp. LMS25]UTR15239.1 polysaccharide deacetylase family protein [Salipaludibacillus sp. LMS25]
MYKTLSLSVLFWSAMILTACENEEGPHQQTTINNNMNNGYEQNDHGVNNQEEVIDANGHDEEDTSNNKEKEKEEVESLYKLDNSEVRPIDDADEQVVLLTIDDAPDHYSVEMAGNLKELDAGAIFFVNGHFLESEKGREDLQHIYDLGFEIGNHTMTHQDLTTLSEDEQYEEIVQLNDLIEEVLGERPRFFRAPFGKNTDYSKQLVKEENMQWMNWTYGYDFVEEYMEEEALTDVMIDAPELRAGANLLMHDREFTKDALDNIVIGLREKGYEIVAPETIE